MEKNLLRYFSLLLVSFSITALGQIKQLQKAYAADIGTNSEIQNPGTNDIYNFRIVTGEELKTSRNEHNLFKADVVNNMHKIKIQFDAKEGINPEKYIVTGTDNSIGGTISEEQPYILTADLVEGENTIKILDKSTNEEMYRFDINYKSIKVNGLENIIKVGDISRLEAVIDGGVYDNVYWKSTGNGIVVIDDTGNITALQSGIASVTGIVYNENNTDIIGNIYIEFNISGEGVSGWIKNGDKWYYVDPGTKELIKGWIQDKGEWYYFNEDGSLYTGWLKQGEDWYYLKKTGNMAIGWFKDNNSWYYFDGDGKMKTGWFKDHGNWYYFSKDGKMQTSNITIDGSLYKFNNHGELQMG